MTEVISVQFRGRGKAYYFAPGSVTAASGDKLVVETAKGLELGVCTEGNHAVDDSGVVQPLRPVVRAATADDLRVEEINLAREKEAYGICQEKIARHGLDMKLVDVECSFEGNKILFFFTADGRVDFRELVKDLAGVFRTRIELRQIGVRDEAKMLGGLGICGRPFCCSQFLEDFQPVSTKMAKTQSMSLNPAKISGTCGRLMCCLRYEQEAYEDLVKHVPKVGAFVQTADGYGNVVLVNLLRQSVKVRMDGVGDPVFHTYPVEDIAEIPGGRPAEGEPLPQVLQPRPKVKKVEPVPDAWVMPKLIVEPGDELTAAEPAAPAAAQPEQPAAPAAVQPERTPEQTPLPRRDSGRRRRSRGKGGPGPIPGGAPRPGQPAGKLPGRPNLPGGKPPRAPQPGVKSERIDRPIRAPGEIPAKKNSRHRRPGKPRPPLPDGGSKPEA